LRAVVAVGWLQVFGSQLSTSQQLKVHASDTKTASEVPPGDGRLIPTHETCKGLRHNKVFVKVY
jgi:hypothetical protein